MSDCVVSSFMFLMFRLMESFSLQKPMRFVSAYGDGQDCDKKVSADSKHVLRFYLLANHKLTKVIPCPSQCYVSVL